MAADPHGADLHGADLHGADLHGTAIQGRFPGVRGSPPAAAGEHAGSPALAVSQDPRRPAHGASSEASGGVPQDDLHEQELRLAAIAGLESMTTGRLARLLAGREPSELWEAIRAGRIARDVADLQIRREWQRAATPAALQRCREALRALGARVSGWGHPDHPAELRHDIDPAPLLFRRGLPLDAGAIRVGVVGTRRCSGAGREVAYELGHDLSAAGVSVVSGLAKGIDGAAHRGAVAARGAPPIAVVGGGIDVIYPRSNADLWRQIVETGTLCGEAPLGAEPAAWRFPARNRLIAALSDVLVVVESRATGGSLLTVEQAIRRGVDVMAVPGSLRNGAADGTNQLLVDGCAPVRSAQDVLIVAGLCSTDAAARRRGEPRPGLLASATGDDPRIPLDAAGVLVAVDDGPTSVEQLMTDTGLGLSEVYAALEALIASGLVVRDGSRVRRA